MNIISLGFLCFCAASLAAYYALPASRRWIALLASSAVMVLSLSRFGFAFIALSAASLYFAGRAFEKLDAAKKSKRPALIAALLFNLGALFLLKFVPEGLLIVDDIFGTALSAVRAPIHRYLLPIGLSYYTLQAVSYLLDVYWGRIPAEKSFFRLLLYLSYFPLLVQGPIHKYQKISGELFAPKPFEAKNLKFGMQLMLWGYFKKLAIADNAAPYVSQIFYEGGSFTGLPVFIGLVFYGIQLYCDFSGGIDVVRGLSQCFGVRLGENFRQPFFSKSLAEFWRRWHISLGDFMKDYVFYPFSLSKGAAKIKKALKGKVSRKVSGRILAAIGNLLVFTLVGLWHGTGSKYLGWGLYNGLILIFSSLMVDVYAAGLKKCRIDKNAACWQAFSLARTFLIVTIGWVFDVEDTAWEAIGLFFKLFVPYAGGLQAALPPFRSMAALAFCGIVLLVSLLRERGASIREALAAKPLVLQIAVWTALIQLTACFGRFVAQGGFMYANF